MTREERENAIKVIKNYDLNFPKINRMLFKAGEIANAFVCALEALEQKPCEDCVSRQAILDLATTIETDDYSGNEILEVVEVSDIIKNATCNTYTKDRALDNNKNFYA